MVSLTTKNRVNSSLLLKFLLLLLAVVVPVSAAVGIFNYANTGELLKARTRSQQQGWASSHRDVLAIELVQESERLLTFSTNDVLLANLQTFNTQTAVMTNTASLWQSEGEDSNLRYNFVNGSVGRVLSQYRQTIPNRVFALLGNSNGALVGVTTMRWPEYDLRKFSWWPRSRTSSPITITEPQDIPGIGDNIVLIISTIPNPTDPLAADGILVVGLNSAEVIKPLLVSQLPEGETAWLVNRDGKALETYTTSSIAATAPQTNTLSPNIHVPQTWLSNFLPTTSNSLELKEAEGFPAVVLSYAPLQLPLGYSQNNPQIVNAVNRLGWTVVRSAPQSLAYAELNSPLIGLVIGTIITFVGIIAVIMLTVGILLLRPIREIDRAMEKVAQGDFTAQVATHSHDELARLGNRFNSMVGDLDTLLREREQHQQEQLQVGATLQDSAMELQSSVAQQNAFASQQAAALAEISATFSQLSQSAIRIAQYSQQVAQAAEVLQAEQQQGSYALQQTRKVLNQLRTDSESLQSLADSLSLSSNAISNVVEELNDIADETKLLSLNAAIEASSAGLAGRRFAVIASEVQSLADQSNTAAVSAQQSLTEVQENISTAVSSIQRELETISEGVQHSDRLEDLMDAVADTIGKLNQSVGIIQLDTKHQQEGSVAVAGTIDALVSAGRQLADLSRNINNEASALTALAGKLNTQAATLIN